MNLNEDLDILENISATSYKQNKRDFILNNIDLLDDYEFDEIHRDILRKWFKMNHDIHLQEKCGEFTIDEIGFSVNSNLTYDKLTDEFSDFLDKRNLSTYEVKKIIRFNFLKQTYFEDGKSPKIRFGWNHFLNQFIDLILYMKTGTLMENLKEANDIIDKYDMRGGHFNVKISELGISVKKFKNGKVQVKELNEDIWKEIYKLKEKIENN